jgi:GoLoco motif
LNVQSQPRGQTTVNSDDLFELISRSQSRRIDDQRYSLRHAGPLNGRSIKHDSNSVAKQEPVVVKNETPHTQVQRKEQDDDQFFDQLLRSQVGRVEAYPIMLGIFMGFC